MVTSVKKIQSAALLETIQHPNTFKLLQELIKTRWQDMIGYEKEIGVD